MNTFQLNLLTILIDSMKHWTFKCKDLRLGRLKELTEQPHYLISSIQSVSSRISLMALKNLKLYLVYFNRPKEELIQSQAENSHLMAMLLLIGLKKRYTLIWYCQMIRFHQPCSEDQRVFKEKWSPVRSLSLTRLKWNLKRVLGRHQ